MKKPLGDIIEQLPLDKEIKDTLIGVQIVYRDVLDLVIAIEKGDWAEITTLCHKLGIGQDKLSSIYIEALKWTKEISADSAPTLQKEGIS